MKMYDCSEMGAVTSDECSICHFRRTGHAHGRPQCQKEHGIHNGKPTIIVEEIDYAKEKEKKKNVRKKR